MKWKQITKTPLLTALALVCLNLSPFCQAASGELTDLGQRISIDVTNASPQSVFRLLAEVLECQIKVRPKLKTPITLRRADARVADILATLSQLIDCEWRFDGKNLYIRPMPASRKHMQRAQDAFDKKLASPLPAGLRFESVPLKSALNAVGKAARLELQPWRDEGDHQVTLDVGGKTVDEALKDLIAQIPSAEGVVMIRHPNFGMAQRRYFASPEQKRSNES